MERLWEIDSARGIAVILMIIFNWSFTLRYLNVYTVNAGWAYWYLFPRIVASIFIFVAGISLALSHNRVKNKPKKYIYLKYLIRGLKIFSLGLIITFITWLLFPEAFIVFGILHFIGISIILSISFMKFKKLNLVLGTILIGLNYLITNSSKYLLWLVNTNNLYTFDYFPLIPWFGIILIGIYFGNSFYNKLKWKNNNSLPVKITSYLGRNSLIIYFLHQPVLLFILFVLGFL